MKFKEVDKIQQKCQKAMRLWGYAEAKDQMDLLKFNPVSEIPKVLKEWNKKEKEMINRD